MCAYIHTYIHTYIHALRTAAWDHRPYVSLCLSMSPPCLTRTLSRTHARTGTKDTAPANFNRRHRRRNGCPKGEEHDEHDVALRVLLGRLDHAVPKYPQVRAGKVRHTQGDAHRHILPRVCVCVCVCVHVCVCARCVCVCDVCARARTHTAAHPRAPTHLKTRNRVPETNSAGEKPDPPESAAHAPE